MTDVSQDIRIKIMNDWLKENNLNSIYESGFCHGDANLWALYTLLGKEQYYEGLTNEISQLKKGELSQLQTTNSELYLDIINYFESIILYQNPQAVFPGFTQIDNDKLHNFLLGKTFVDSSLHHQTHEIESNSPVSTMQQFNFGWFYESTEELAFSLDSVFKQIKNDHVAILKTTNHTFALRYHPNDNTFDFMDPNSESGVVKGLNLIEVVSFIKRKLLVANKQEFSLNINLLSFEKMDISTKMLTEDLYFIKHHLTKVPKKTAHSLASTILHAAQENDITTIESLVRLYPDQDMRVIFNMPSPYDVDPFRTATPLFVARTKPMVDYLCSLGADVNAKNNHAQTPLNFAVSDKNLQVINALLEHNANGSIKDKYGKTALEYAIENDQGEIALLLIKNNEGNIDLEKIDSLYNDEKKMLLKYAIVKEDGPLASYLAEHIAMPLNYINENYDMLRYFFYQSDGSINQERLLTLSPYQAGIFLCLAAKNGDSTLAKHLLSQNQKLIDAMSNNHDVFSYAISNNQLDVIKVLLEYDDVNHQNPMNGLTPLHIACEKNDGEIINYLIEKMHADINIQKNDMATPLYHAVSSKNQIAVKLLIEKGASKNIAAEFVIPASRFQSSAIKEIWYPIQKAIVDENYPILALLFKHPDGSIDESQFELLNLDQKVTSLLICAKYGDVEIIKHMLNQEPSLLEYNKNGAYPFTVAILNSQFEAVKALLNHITYIPVDYIKDGLIRAKNVPADLDQQLKTSLPNDIDFSDILEQVIVRQNFDRAQQILQRINSEENKYSIDKLSINSRTFLFFLSASHGDVVLVKTLSQKYPELFQRKDSKSWDVFAHAILNNQLGSLQTLLESQDVNRTILGTEISLLHTACETDYLEIVQYMIEDKKANIDIQNGDGATPLFMAVQSGKHDIVKYLIDKGASKILPAIFRGNQEWPPIKKAIEKNDYQMVSMLIRDKEGYLDLEYINSLNDEIKLMLLDIVKLNFDFEVFDYLVENLNKINEDSLGRERLKAAAKQAGRDSVVEFMEKNFQLVTKENLKEKTRPILSLNSFQLLKESAKQPKIFVDQPVASVEKAEEIASVIPNPKAQ